MEEHQHVTHHTLTIKKTVIEARGTDDAHLEFDDYSLVAGEAGKCHIAIGVTHAPYLTNP